MQKSYVLKRNTTGIDNNEIARFHIVNFFIAIVDLLKIGEGQFLGKTTEKPQNCSTHVLKLP